MKPKPTNVIDVREQLRKILLHQFQVTLSDQLLFTIEADPEKGYPYSNMSDLLRLRVFPTWKDRQFTTADIISMLTMVENRLPLWVKLYETEKGRLYHLLISKRFHGKKVIEERHPDNEFRPFEAPDILPQAHV